MSDVDTAEIRAGLDNYTGTDREGWLADSLWDTLNALDDARAAEKHQHSERWIEKDLKREAIARAEAAEARIAAAMEEIRNGRCTLESILRALTGGNDD